MQWGCIKRYCRYHSISLFFFLDFRDVFIVPYPYDITLSGCHAGRNPFATVPGADGSITLEQPLRIVC